MCVFPGTLFVGVFPCLMQPCGFLEPGLHKELELGALGIKFILRKMEGRGKIRQWLPLVVFLSVFGTPTCGLSSACAVCGKANDQATSGGFCREPLHLSHHGKEYQATTARVLTSPFGGINPRWLERPVA